MVFGWGRLDDLPNELERLGTRRVLLIAESSTAWIAEAITQSLGDRVIASIPKAMPHVPVEQVEGARSLAGAERIDSVVTVGGGTATGLGKAIAVSGPLLIALPTTYAGSEMTAVYGVTGDGRKRTDRDERALPRTVLYDPRLTTTLPARPTATTGMNAIAHSVEALYGEGATPLTDLIALEAVRVLADALPACVRAPDRKAARTSALYGAFLAGRVLQATGMAIHHRICHVLGGTYGLAHGDANAVVLPHAVAFNDSAAAPSLARVARTLGTSEAAGGLFDLARELGAPASLKELGLPSEVLERAASLVVEGSYYNPRPAGFEDVLGILKNAYDGIRP